MKTNVESASQISLQDGKIYFDNSAINSFKRNSIIKHKHNHYFILDKSSNINITSQIELVFQELQIDRLIISAPDVQLVGEAIKDYFYDHGIWYVQYNGEFNFKRQELINIPQDIVTIEEYPNGINEQQTIEYLKQQWNKDHFTPYIVPCSSYVAKQHWALFENLLKDGRHILFRQSNNIVGHLALIPMDDPFLLATVIAIHIWINSGCPDDMRKMIHKTLLTSAEQCIGQSSVALHASIFLKNYRSFKYFVKNNFKPTFLCIKKFNKAQ